MAIHKDYAYNPLLHTTIRMNVLIPQAPKDTEAPEASKDTEEPEAPKDTEAPEAPGHREDDKRTTARYHVGNGLLAPVSIYGVRYPYPRCCTFRVNNSYVTTVCPRMNFPLTDSLTITRITVPIVIVTVVHALMTSRCLVCHDSSCYCVLDNERCRSGNRVGYGFCCVATVCQPSCEYDQVVSLFWPLSRYLRYAHMLSVPHVSMIYSVSLSGYGTGFRGRLGTRFRDSRGYRVRW